MRQGRRAPVRWETDFGRWVGQFGVGRIVEEFDRRAAKRDENGATHPELRVARQAVQHWIAGRHCPRPEHARLLVELSQGRLTLEQVYAHIGQVRRSQAWRSMRTSTPRA